MRLKFPVITLLQTLPSKLSHPLNPLSYRNGHNTYEAILDPQKEKYLLYLCNACKRKAGFCICHWSDKSSSFVCLSEKNLEMALASNMSSVVFAKVLFLRKSSMSKL